MKMTDRGTITIPKRLRERYGLSPDVEMEIVPDEKGLVLRKKLQGHDPVAKWRGVLKGPLDVDAYIEEVRGR